MIQVYYAKTAPFEREDFFQHYLEKTEETRKAKILRTRAKEARVRSLAAGSLLQEALCRYTGLPKDTVFKTGTGPGGKPFLTEYKDLSFNLSHSGGYVCCAVGKAPVGVDIQQYTKVRAGLAERFFTKEDVKLLEDAADAGKEALFFRIWSIRESYIKFTGKGMSQGLSSFCIDWKHGRITEPPETGNRELACFAEQTALEGYAACLCFQNTAEKAVWTEISF